MWLEQLIRVLIGTKSLMFQMKSALTLKKIFIFCIYLKINFETLTLILKADFKMSSSSPSTHF